MSKRKYTVRAECPSCACGDVSFLGPDKLREKFIGDEKEIEILCPMCGTRHKGKIEDRGREGVGEEEEQHGKGNRGLFNQNG